MRITVRDRFKKVAKTVANDLLGKVRQVVVACTVPHGQTLLLVKSADRAYGFGKSSRVTWRRDQSSLEALMTAAASPVTEPMMGLATARLAWSLLGKVLLSIGNVLENDQLGVAE